MPADGPVSVRRQCVYAAVPILDMYSAYHIGKLRMYLLVVICTIMIPQVAIEYVLFDSIVGIEDAYTAFLQPGSAYFGHSVYVMIWTAAGIAWSVVLIRHWSMRWNAGAAWGRPE